MRFRPLALSIFLGLLVPAFAEAGSNDKEVTELVGAIMAGDYQGGNFDAALEQLAFAKQGCEGNTCSAKVKGKVFIALGTVLAAKKKTAEAKSAFILALKEDPGATLYPEYKTPEAEAAFKEASGGSGGGAAAGAGGAAGGAATAGGGAAAAPPPEATLKPKKEYQGEGKPGRGWKTGEGYFYYQEAVSSEGSRDWTDCAAYGRASLAAENRVTTRYLTASCEERAGLWVEAQANYTVVADTAAGTGLREVARQARTKSEELSQKVPKIVIQKPAKATGLVVKLNNVEVPASQLGGEIWVNPGPRTVTAKGSVEGVAGEFEQVVDAQEFEKVTVDIKLLPPGSRVRDATVLKCMSEAKTPDDFARCVGAGGASKSALNFAVGLEFSAYHDSDNTDVITPAVLGRIDSPTGGFGATASLLVDVVSTASADVVANASPRWTEVRYVPAISGRKKIGDVDLSLGGGASVEPDYTSIGGSLGAAIDLRQKTVTPSLTYGFGYDLSYRTGQQLKYARPITRHTVDAAATIVIDKATFFIPSVSLVFESGDSSKPYRYIPMFEPAVAEAIRIAGSGVPQDLVNTYRNQIRVLEQLPLSRQRYALAGRIAHRFASSTFRAEERIYLDSWGLKASTTDAQFLFDATKELRAWPHLRLHVQDKVDFWQIAYVATSTPTGIKLPVYRTGDRELGPLLGLTLGAGARYAFGKDKNWALTATFDFVYTRFLDTLYILQRFGYFGATTLEAGFD